MCGIFGTINKAFDGSTLDLLRHRGPDDGGVVDLTVGRHSVRLGHRRLSIVDLSAVGHQPMGTACGRYWLIYNGEVYNHMDLRRAMPDTAFRGHSDTETILHCLARQDTAAVSGFNGIFAIAFTDMVQGKLFLARDPFGVKPLYYHFQGKSAVFSSEIKPMLRLINETVDRASLAETLRLRYCPAPDTLFTNVKKVRPGHVVEFDLGTDEIKVREFPFVSGIDPVQNIPFGEACSRYAELFAAAVNRQLMSDVEIGILLSGGMDSALVAAYARKQGGRRMKAFTIGFTDSDAADETADAQETAQQLGLEYHHTRIGFPDMLETMQKCVDIVEEPLATTSIIPMFYLSELAARHVKVVLSGQGADEPLGGYGRYQLELYRRFVTAGMATSLTHAAARFGLRNDQILRGLAALRHRQERERFLSTYSVFRGEEIEALTGEREHRAAARLDYVMELLQFPEHTPGAAKMMSVDLRMDLADDLLLYTDKITMHHSIECRVPILDIDLIRFIESLPVSFRVRLGRGKILHKTVAGEVLPREIVQRKKKGFQSPTRAWFRDAGTLRDILLDRTSRFASYFNLRPVEAVINEHQNGFNRERQLFLLLGIHHWLRRYA